MKILKIRIRNMHSLKGDHLIDFTSGVLSDAGLFVITGPTGAGKSTILDAITLALYNRVPRMSNKDITSKIIEEEGIIITKNAKECLAEVEYEVKGRKYLSSWTINRNRNNKLNERKQELIDQDTGTILISGKSEVVAENTTIIGLSYDQFVQSLVLAQGQFAKLLLSKKDERNKLLEDITGASVYRKIGKEVFIKFSKAAKDVELQKAKMQGIELLSKEEIASILEELKAIRPIAKKNNEQKKTLEHKLKIKNEILLLNEKSILLDKEFAHFTITKEELKSDESKLIDHTKFIIYKSRLDEIESRQKNVTRLKSRNADLLSKLVSINEKKQLIIKSATELTNQQLNLLSFEFELVNFKERVASLILKETEKHNDLKQEAKRIADKLNELLKYNIAVHFDQEIEPTVENILRAIESEAKEIGLFTVDDIRARKEQLNKFIIPATQVIGDGKLFQEKKQNLETEKIWFSEKEELLKELIISSNELKLQIASLSPIVVNLKMELDDFIKIKNLDTHRHELIKDKPCPLCGSTEHPFVTEYSKIDLSDIQKKYEEQKKLLEELNVKQIKNDADRERLNEELSFASETQKQKDKEIATLYEKILQICNTLTWNPDQAILEWEQNLELWQNEIQLLDEFERKLSAKITLQELQQLTESHRLLKREYEIANKSRTQIYKGIDIHQDVSNLLQNYKANEVEEKASKDLLQEVTKELELENKTCEALEKQLISELNALQIKSIDALKTKLLNEEHAETIRKSIQELRDKKTILDTRRKDLNSELNEFKKVDDTLISIKELSESLYKLENEIENIQRQIGSLEQRIVIDQDNRERNKNAQEELDGLQKELDLWSKMNALIGDATGKKFSNFVQDLTLEQLIHFGNKRLTGFSDRYLLDTPNPNESEALKVIDTFMGNTRRAVSTLSGGETFKLSLALAFGLSDLAAKNVEIESLFIDEGFGSLDPESLDQSISILENMQYHSNKSIGIISHVNELKDRIGTKIKLIQTGSGYSKIEIE